MAVEHDQRGPITLAPELLAQGADPLLTKFHDKPGMQASPHGVEIYGNLLDVFLNPPSPPNEPEKQSERICQFIALQNPDRGQVILVCAPNSKLARTVMLHCNISRK